MDDVGITQSGMILGTPLFMSPEQAQSESVDHRADLFSLGCVLYAMLTGDSPFRANGTLATLKRLSEETPRPVHEVAIDTPLWLSDLISKLLARDPNERIGSAREVAQLLTAFLTARGQKNGVVAGLPTEPPCSTEGLPELRNDADQTQHGRPAVGAKWLGRETDHNIVESGHNTGKLVGKRTRVACATVAVLLLLGAIVFKLKTRSFELTVEVPDAPSQTNSSQTPSVAAPPNNVPDSRERKLAETLKITDPACRAIEWFRNWDPAVRIRIQTASDPTHELSSDESLPAAPFTINSIAFHGDKVIQAGDRLAEIVAEPLRGVLIEHYLQIKSKTITPAGVGSLIRLPSFANVNLVQVEDAESLDDRLFAELLAHPKLVNLSLSNAPRLTGRGLSRLGSFSNFEILTMIDCSLSPEAARELRQLTKLNYLNLSAVTLTDEHAAELAKTPIRDLILASCSLNDHHLEQLARNQSVRKLVLPNNDPTDASIPSLKQATWLKELDLGSTRITPTGIAELKQALPNCKIEWSQKPQGWLIVGFTRSLSAWVARP